MQRKAPSGDKTDEPADRSRPEEGAKVAVGKSPFIPPRLTLRVGVVGHRLNRLEGADTNMLQARAGNVMACVSEVVAQVKRDDEAREQRLFAADKPELRLTTALAEGADRIVARAALEHQHSLNVILPFRRPIYEEDFEGEALTDFGALLSHDAVATVTELDTSETPHDPAAYEALGGVLLDHTDVLIAIWDGKPAAGPGGTANIVDEARRRRLVVVLLSPSGELQLWSTPHRAVEPLADGEWRALDLSAADDRCSNALAEEVKRLLVLPSPPPTDTKLDNEVKPEHRLLRFIKERVRSGSYAFGYDLLRRAYVRGRSFDWRINYRFDEEQQAAWGETLASAKTIGGKEFADSLDSKLRQRWIGADNLAVHYSQKFRSTYIANFVLAALAVLIGLLAVFFWEDKGVKAVCVALELVLLAIILGNTFRGKGAHWQRRWLDYRSLAEALRPARLHLLIGGSPARPGDATARVGGEAWVAWYVRGALREIPPPTGVIDRVALAEALKVARLEEIDGQVDYHQRNAATLKPLDRSLERTAEWAFGLAAGAGLLYLILYGLYEAELSGFVADYKPLATVLAASLPVFGAAVFGIRATGDFRAAMHQSERMVAELNGLHERLASSTDPARVWVDQSFDLLSHTMSEDLKLWGMIYSERELAAGF